MKGRLQICLFQQDLSTFFCLKIQIVQRRKHGEVEHIPSDVRKDIFSSKFQPTYRVFYATWRLCQETTSAICISPNILSVFCSRLHFFSILSIFFQQINIPSFLPIFQAVIDVLDVHTIMCYICYMSHITGYICCLMRLG